MNPNDLKIAVCRWLFVLVLGGLPTCGFADDVEDQITRLGDQNPAVRRAAAEALGKLRDVRAVEPLIARLKDQKVDYPFELWVGVRTSAALALGKIGDARAVEPLIACLNDPFRDVPSAAGDALVALGKPAVEPLIAYWKGGARWPLFLLARLGDPRAVEPLIARLKDGDDYERAPVAEALGKSRDARAVEPLIVCLKNQDWGVQRSAADALARFGEPVLERLIACLKDQDVGMRRGAADALGKLGEERAVGPLIAGLQDHYPYVRYAAADALVELGKPAVEPLIACLDDKDRDVRETAVEALGAIGEERAMGGLVKALPDWDCRSRFGVALEKLGWRPASDVEQTYSWICNSDGANLRAHWEKTRQFLLADVQSGDSRKIQNTVCTFISLGSEEMVPQLIDLLTDHGNKEMAELLTCGHRGLANAASSWASAHGCILSNPGKATWGLW